MKMVEFETQEKLRKSAQALYGELSVPDRHDDNYRFSPFIGFEAPELSDNPPRIEVVMEKSGEPVFFGQFSEIAEKLQGINADFLGIPKKFESDYYTLQNFAHVEKTWVVYVPENVILEKPIEIGHFPGASSEAGESSYLQILIIAGKNSKFDLVEKFSSNSSNEKGFLNCFSRLWLSEGAKVRLHSFQNLSDNTSLVRRHYIQLHENADLNFSAMAIGAERSQIRTEVDLIGRGACAELVHGLRSKGKQHSDFWTSLNHEAEDTEAHSKLFMVLDDQSRGVFNGNQVVLRKALRTDSSQVNKNMLLSEGASVQTLPKLEIDTDDVQCSHGASVVNVDDNQLFYLTSRGISPENSRTMIVNGFLEVIFEKVPDEGLREAFREEFRQKFLDF